MLNALTLQYLQIWLTTKRPCAISFVLNEVFESPASGRLMPALAEVVDEETANAIFEAGKISAN
jgi:hypothetical protein